jgi:hypothetical protein
MRIVEIGLLIFNVTIWAILAIRIARVFLE